METKDVFDYYIEYELKVALASETMKQVGNYTVSRRDLNKITKVKDIFDLLKKDDIVNGIRKKLRKDALHEFDKLIVDIALEDIDGPIMQAFNNEKIKKQPERILEEITCKKETNDVKVLCPFYDETPLYILDCEIDSQIRVHHISVSETTLIKLLSRALCVDKVVVLSDYGEEVIKFHNFLKTIHYQLDIKEIIHICNEELERIFDIKIMKCFASNAAFVKDYAGGSFHGIRDDLLAIRSQLKDTTILSKPLMKYLSLPAIQQDIKAYENTVYYGSYVSKYPVNKTQFQIVNSIDHHSMISVEGPPGAGKSSLLKEIIANSFVKRTYQLVKDWDKPWQNIDEIYEVPFHEDVINSILITSKNGEAIDNIDSDINKEIEYFHDLASAMKIKKQEVLIEPNYTGILCAKLGNKDNKTTFFEFFDQTFIKHLSTYDKEVDVEELLHDFQQHYDGLTSIYEDLNSIENVLGNTAFNKKNILTTKQKASIELDSCNKQLDITSKQKEEISQHLSKAKDTYERQIKRIDRINIDIHDLEERIERTEDACLLYKQYEGLSKFKRLFDPAVRSFLKKHTIFDLVNEIGDMKKKIKEYRLELDELNEKVIQTNSSCMKVQDEYTIVEQSYDTLTQQLLYVKQTIKNIEICERLNDVMQDDIASYECFHDIFSNAYLFKKRQELFKLSIQINEAYIYQHREEILANFTIFWDGTYLCRKFYQSSGEYTKTKASAIRRLWNTFQLCFPVITSTLDSCVMNQFQLLPELFDLVMVDEAGQVLPHCLLPALYRSKRALIVGDVAQLEPIENIHNYSLCDFYEDEDKQLLKHLDIEKRSIQIQANESSEVINNDHSIVLNDHYRCEENIVAFSKQYIYQDLRCHVKNSFDKPFENNLLHFDVRGMKATNKHINTSEANAVIALIKKIKEFEKAKKKQEDFTIGVITPFKDQRDEIKNLLKKHKLNGVAVGTIHAYQGKQMDYIIMSTVLDDMMDASKLHVLNNFIGEKPNMLNVALTRAMKQFILIGNYDCIKKSNNYLAKAFDIIEEKGNVYSMFLEPIETYTKNYNQDVLDVLNARKQFDNTSIVGRYLEETLPHGLIEDPKLHYEIFKFGLNNVKDSFFVCSPWIRSSVLNEDTLRLIQDKIKAKIRIEMTIGYKKPTKKESEESIVSAVSPYHLQKDTEKLLNAMMKRFGDNVHVTPPLHSKFLILDDKYMFIGSHNWLSNSGKTDTKELSTLVTDVDAIEYVKKKYLALKDISRERLAPIW